MTVTEWGVVLGVVGVVTAMLFPWLLSIHGKVSRIEEKTTAIAERAEEDRGEHTRLWGRSDNHEHRIIVLEQKPQSQ